MGPTQPKPIGCIPPSVTIATRGMGRVGGTDLLELPACALRETGVVAKGKPPRDPRNGGNLEAWDLTRVWRHGWIRADTSHDDMP